MSVRAWIIVLVAAAVLTTTIAWTYAASQEEAVTATASIGPLTPTDPDRLPAAERAAIEALRSAPTDPQPEGHGHGDLVRYDEVPMTPAENEAFDAQWQAAAREALRLSTAEAARAAGYVTATVWGGGVGTHYVKWSLIDRPFDPALPSMLLIDDRPGRQSRLIGFSYWVRSDTEPDGFAGGNDHWHRHPGDCIVNGWVDGENVADPSQCAGVWFAGGDMWMLHAWIVPGIDNRWGAFATIHPALCPGPGTPDLMRCPVGGFER